MKLSLLQKRKSSRKNRNVAVWIVLLVLLVWGMYWTPKIQSHLLLREKAKEQPQVYTMESLEWRNYHVAVETMGWNVADTAPLGPSETAKQDLKDVGVTFFKETELKLDPATGDMKVRNTAKQLQLIEAYLDSRGAVSK